MSKHLLIVESPAKAKTIEKFLGKDFTVKSSYGHIRDLMKGTKGIDIANNFSPRYEVSEDKHKVVRELKEWVRKVDEVWLATDEDREGEAISWHLCQVLGLDEHKTKRIVFREITKPAIQKAIQSPRFVDTNLVNAQQARRVLDRLVGFELSELLWRKIKGKLSAGRVQSVALKLVVDKERDILAFNTTPFFRVTGDFLAKTQQKTGRLKAELNERFDQATDAEGFLKQCIGAIYKVANIEVKPTRRKPAAPFTTSTLQQEASRKLGFSVNRTMVAAQRLYEQGFITYMRTDSTSLSETALQSIASEVEKLYGKNHVHTRQYKTNKAGAQEAHEAIRPTYIENQTVPVSDRDMLRLYELIWKRTIASQMAEAELEKTIVDISISKVPGALMKAEGEVVKFEGFLKVYLDGTDDEPDEETGGMLPPLSVGQELTLEQLQATERFTRPPSRFTEASLVKKLEELGIGRPSTYAPTISKIMEEGRGYVVKGINEGEERHFKVMTLDPQGKIHTKTDMEKTGSDKGKLVPTPVGMVVSDFLAEHFKTIMNFGFTAEIEKQFDEIAAGGVNWQNMIADFYGPFHALVENTQTNASRADGERILGKDPATGRTVLVRISRLGRPVVQIGAQEELDKEEKPQYANLRPGQRMEDLELEEALKLFDLPKTLGVYDGLEVVVGAGRFGPYVKHGESYVSLPRGEDPLSVDMDKAIALIEEKRKADAPFTTYKGHPVTKGKGRFGPFIKWNGIFVNVPRKYDLDHLKPEEAHTLIAAKVDKEANRYINQWDTTEGISIALENGRWGPFIRVGKEAVNLPKNEEGKRMTQEDAALLSLDEVKAIISQSAPELLEPPKKKVAKARKVVKK